MLKDILWTTLFEGIFLPYCQRLIKCGIFSYIKIYFMFLTNLKVFKQRLCTKNLSYNDGLQMVGEVYD